MTSATVSTGGWSPSRSNSAIALRSPSNASIGGLVGHDAAAKRLGGGGGNPGPVSRRGNREHRTAYERELEFVRADPNLLNEAVVSAQVLQGGSFPDGVPPARDVGGVSVRRGRTPAARQPGLFS